MSIIDEVQIIKKERQEQYGDIRENFQVASELVKLMYGIDVPPIHGMMFLEALKIARDKKNFKEDNWIDRVNYTATIGEWLKQLNN